jgi:hypothetical protein
LGVRRPELVIAAAIAISLPMLPSFLDGGISPVSAIVRFAIALALCWAAGSVIERVYDTYARHAREAEIQRAIEEARRRLSDPSRNGPEET